MEKELSIRNQTAINIINKKLHGKEIEYPKFLYKYRPFDEFAFDMLENDYLYLCPAEKLDDPSECKASLEIQDLYDLETNQLKFKCIAGILDYIKPYTSEENFEKAAFNLGDGQVSEAVENDNGVYVIKCISNYDEAATLENKKKGFNLRTVIPLATIIVSLVFIVVGLKNYGFWKAQPTPGFFPIIIAVVLLASSIACFVQIARDKNSDEVKYNRNELMVMLGAAGIILGTFLIGLVPSCLIYIFLWLKLVERAPWKVIIIIEIIMAAIILGVFTGWLQIRFPMGLLGDLIF